MITKMIVATDISDEERRSLFWHLLANTTDDFPTENSCEIDASSWDEDAWDEWRFQLSKYEDYLDPNLDSVAIWYLQEGEVERQILGRP